MPVVEVAIPDRCPVCGRGLLTFVTDDRTKYTCGYTYRDAMQGRHRRSRAIYMSAAPAWVIPIGVLLLGVLVWGVLPNDPFKAMFVFVVFATAMFAYIGWRVLQAAEEATPP